MTHDKKNDADGINFTLLSDVGKIVLNHHAAKDEIFECLDILL
jgi:3-dehydroquinate synthase